MKISVARVFGPDGERQRSSQVLSFGRIVHNEQLAPYFVNLEIAMHAELRDKARDYTEKSTLIEVVHPNQLVEAIGSPRRPCPARFHHEIALRGFKFDPEILRNHHFSLFLLAAR